MVSLIFASRCRVKIERTAPLLFLFVALILGVSTAAAGPTTGPTGSRQPDARDQIIRRTCGSTPPSAARAAVIDRELEPYVAMRSLGVQALPEIPVAFHIIQNSSGANRATSAQITRQLEVLNQSFVGVATFTLLSIQTVTRNSWFSVRVRSAGDREMRRSLRVGGAGVLNVFLHEPFLRNRGDLLGYASFPSEYERDPQYDGVSVSYRSLPGGSLTLYNRGRTLVHEVGHWLGLLHTFQPPFPSNPLSSTNNGCRGSGDFVSDTAAEARPSYLCQARDSCPRNPGNDPIRNFMNYTPDRCMTGFSAGQRVRMLAAWDRYRSS